MSSIAVLTEISAGSIQAGSEKTGASREAPGGPPPRLGLRPSPIVSQQRTRTGLFQTMLLTELITPEAVVPSLKVNSKKRALQELSDRAGLISGLAPREIFDVLLQRERLGSTGIGEGIAIPHGKLAGAKTMFGIFARLARPIDFHALDGAPVDLICLLIAPETAGADHLKALARMARVLRDPRVTAKLRAARDVSALYAVLTGETASHAA
jgi:PTS system nitrogen regulatory IIA component